MKDKSVRAIFWTMVALFLLVLSTMSIGIHLAGNFPVINIFLPIIAIFTILGVVLLVLTLRKKISGTIKKFLLLTGASAVGLPVFAILHNLVYALLIKLFNFGPDFDEPVFFILAIIVCPLGFLVGAIGTIVLAGKNGKANSSSGEAGP